MYRQSCGLTLGDAAQVLECDRSKLSRVETGQRRIRAKELRELLTYYDVSEPAKATLAAIAHPAKADAWWRDYETVFTSDEREYFHLEMAAAQLQIYDPRNVPSLLQTAGYASAAGDAGLWRPGLGRSVAAEVTLARQRAILKERQPDSTIVIAESALVCGTAGPGVMRAQLERLTEASDNGQISTIQVLPSGSAEAGWGSPFTILRFAGDLDLGVVYLPQPGQGGTYLVGQQDLASYSRRFTRLITAALSPGESARLMWQHAVGGLPVLTVLLASLSSRPGGRAVAADLASRGRARRRCMSFQRRQRSVPALRWWRR
jgi:transcriptional regulator with XRE-family HTH domain